MKQPIFTGMVPESGNIAFGKGLRIKIPTAAQVQEAVERTDGSSFEFRMTPAVSARAFFSKLEVDLTLSISLSNTFQINNLDPGYDLIVGFLPKLSEKLSEYGWSLSSETFGGAPGSAITTVIKIEAINK